ncbi:Ankyrin repeat domain-containing protein 26 [Plecturocebus cupreus]
MLRHEVKKRKLADILYEKIRGHLRSIEERCIKEIEVNKQLQLTLRTRDMELSTVTNNLNQVVQEQNDTQRQLSQERNARILQDEILTNHFCKQKEIALAQGKRNFKIFSFSHFQIRISHSHDNM